MPNQRSSSMQTIDMAEFPLKWRWTDEKYCILPESDLKKIHPLSKAASAIAWKTSLRFVDSTNHCAPSSVLFDSIDNTPAENPESVRYWLTSRIPNEEVIVSWQPDIAVITTTEIFIKYWDDFCYQSSDDVSIWPSSEKWILHYHHHDIFYYGKSKTT